MIKKAQYIANSWSVTKSHIMQFLKDFGGLDQEKALAIYNSLSLESKTHKKWLESVYAATYRDVPDHIKRAEWMIFEDNIKYIYKLPLDKCEQHWVVDYFIYATFKMIARYMWFWYHDLIALSHSFIFKYIRGNTSLSDAGSLVGTRSAM